jgi:hypothetical protein
VKNILFLLSFVAEKDKGGKAPTFKQLESEESN